MSIATAIQNARTKIASAYSACNGKGATMPASGSQNLSNLATTINSIVTDIPTSQLILKWVRTETSGSGATYSLEEEHVGENYTIPADKYKNNTNMVSVILPGDVYSIGNLSQGDFGGECFYGCTSLEYINLENVKNILINSFRNTKLDHIRLSNIEYIGRGSFYGCTNLRTVVIESNNITTINSSYSCGTFRGCTSLSSVTFPSTLVNIQRECFYGCTALKTINGMDNLKNIEQDAFNGCTSFGGFTLTEAVNIGISAFSDCRGSDFYLGNKVKTISNYAFSIYGSDSVLSNTSRTTSLAGIINLPELTSLGAIAFANTKITEVTNLGTITTLEKGGYSSGVFQRCRYLTKVTLPSTITSIAVQTFYYCTTLTTVVILATTPPTLGGTNAFTGCSNLTHIYVPYSSNHSVLNAYKTATNWSSFASKMYELNSDGTIPT